MDYKKIIKNRETRIKILRLLRFVPDKLMLKIQYKIKTGRKLNLKNPKRFTEKIQWYKLYYRNELMPKCVDKFEVREYIKGLGYEKLLNKCFGVFDSIDDIDFDKLPNSFVAKDTLGGGGNAVIIVKDKKSENIPQLKNQMQKWCKIPVKRCNGREWPYYSGKKHRIYIEEFLEQPGGLCDYKFFCFNGKFEFAYYIYDRRLGEKSKLCILSKDYKCLDVLSDDEKRGSLSCNKPEEWEEMIQVAENLSINFPHVRVDMFLWNNKIRFGELTFFDGSGYMNFDPDSFDFEIGEKFRLPKRNI